MAYILPVKGKCLMNYYFNIGFFIHYWFCVLFLFSYSFFCVFVAVSLCYLSFYILLFAILIFDECDFLFRSHSVRRGVASTLTRPAATETSTSLSRPSATVTSTSLTRSPATETSTCLTGPSATVTSTTCHRSFSQPNIIALGNFELFF